jgi:hypothetical protein
MMGKIALIVFLLTAFNPGADIDVNGNVITMDRLDGSPAVVIEVDADASAITLEEAAAEATEESSAEATEASDEAAEETDDADASDEEADEETEL